MHKTLTSLCGILLLSSACVSLKPTTLFDAPSDTAEPAHIENFYALTVLKDKLNSEVWFTPNVNCIEVENSPITKYAGTSAIHLKWDKQEGGCDWIGMGIGWDGWAPKDLSMIMNKAAIQFKAYTDGGKIVSLPLAAAMEDYGGKQAWIGFAAKYIVHNDGEDWATITLPLNDFGWDEFGADETNVKQMIIQFEAAGNVYFDEMTVVPFKGSLHKTYQANFYDDNSITVDGLLNESCWKNRLDVDGNKIAIVGSPQYLFISGEILDDTPLLNTNSGDEVWNGDGVEIAISTNPEANSRRKQLLLSDQHFCLKMGAEKLAWDYQSKTAIEGALIEYKKTQTGYSFEAKIPYSHFNIGLLKPNQLFDLEVAINNGDGTKRIHQSKWNSDGVEGFHKNPSFWGNISFKQTDIE